MNLRVVATLAFACLFTGCESGPRGRVMSDTDQDYSGNRAAGTETFDRLISGSVEKLLKSHSASSGGLGKLKVCCLSVENASGEELGDWQEQIYSLIDTSINRSERYENISKRFVDAALRETRLRPDELFLPAQRRQFVAVLESQGQPVDALLFPKLTRGTTHAGQGVAQKNYMLDLELVDLKTGKSERVAERLRKEYRS